MLLGLELGFQIELLLLKNREFLLSLHEPSARIWNSLTFSFDPGIVVFYQLVPIAAGTLTAAFMLSRIARRHQVSQSELSWKKRWPLLLPAAAFIWLSILG